VLNVDLYLLLMVGLLMVVGVIEIYCFGFDDVFK